LLITKIDNFCIIINCRFHISFFFIGICYVTKHIAYAYKEKGDKEAAINYYTKVVNLGDEQIKMQAEQEIQHLKNK
jgi:hypothetical protein